MAVAAEPQTQVKCGNCRLRLLDVVNQIRSGRVVLEIKCPRCDKMHLQLVGELHE